jgi:hypothetical protein
VLILPVGFSPTISAQPVQVTARQQLLTAQTALVPVVNKATAQQTQQFRQKPGQQLTAENNRFSVIKHRHSTVKQHSMSSEDWTIALFGENTFAENPDNEHDHSQLELFGDDLTQGFMGDCFLVATIVALLKCARQGKTALANMIDLVTWANGSHNTTYFEVKFPGFADQPQYVSLEELNYHEQAKGGIGYRILEMAFAQLNQALGKVSFYNEPSHNLLANFKHNTRLGNTLSCINGGGNPGIALYTLTGLGVETYASINIPNVCDTLSAGLDKMVFSNLPYACVAGTPEGPNGQNDRDFMDDQKRFVFNHAYTLLKSPTPGNFVVVNPWDSKRYRFDITLDEFNHFFAYMYLVQFQNVKPAL